MKICAFTVTYNRLELLKECINSLKHQTLKSEHILVIDNGSTDGTSAWLEQQSGITHIRIENNNGPGQGFYTGFEKALQTGADWIWCMDDDTIPDLNALEELAKFVSFKQATQGITNIGFLASEVLWTDRSICLSNIPQFIDAEREVITGATFVSTLYNVGVLRQVGLPHVEFNQWYLDVEFTFRISKHHPCFYVSNSKVVHKTTSNVYYSWQSVTDQNFGKFQAGLVNYVYLLKVNYFRQALLKAWLRIVWVMFKSGYYTYKKTSQPYANLKVLAKQLRRGLKARSIHDLGSY